MVLLFVLSLHQIIYQIVELLIGAKKWIAFIPS